MSAAHRFRSAAPRRFAWLLWFALLLPLAQAAANSHAYSHTAAELAGGLADLGKATHAAGTCDLCLAGSAVHGGALPSATLLSPSSAIAHAAPLAAFESPWEPAPALAYQGRAPPFALA